MQLKELVFSDIYVGQSDSWLSGVPLKGDPVPTPLEAAEDLLSLRDACEALHKKKNRSEFNIKHDGIAYRASALFSLDEVVYVLRRFPSQVPPLPHIGLHSQITNLLMTPKLTGMIIVAGAFGQGKTTTASSLVSSRLSQFGGVCVGIEDPPEMPLQGRHGEGVCYQTEVEQGEFSGACRLAARWAPSIIFLGEIRDSETAAEALRASINGRLVICTIHADNIILAIERLFSLATGAAGSAEDVSSLMSNGLACVLHQRLEGEPRRPRAGFLWLKGDDTHGARNLIKLRKWGQLGSEINLQANRMFSTMAARVKSSGGF